MIRAAAKNHDDVAVVVDVEGLSARAGRTRRQRRRDGWRPAARLARRPIRARPPYDAAISNWFADAIGETTPSLSRDRQKLAEAMRYGENPHQERGLLPHRRSVSASPPRDRRRASSFPTTTSTIPTPPSNSSPEFDPSRRRRRHHPARQSLRRRRRRVAEGRLRRRCAAIRCRPSAASSRSTAGSTRPRRPRSSRSSPRSSSRRTRTRTPSRSSPPRRTCACSLTGGLPDPRAPVSLRTVAGGFLVQGPRQCRRRRHGAEGRARASDARLADQSNSPSASPST